MRYAVLMLTAAVIAVPAPAQQATGNVAGNFRLTDADGTTVQLADFRGRPVVLEWNNPGCPFVQKHYTSGNMQRTQAAARGGGAAWLTINSGAPGKQGHMTGAEAKAFVAGAKAKPTAYLLDPAGRVGAAMRPRRRRTSMSSIPPDGWSIRARSTASRLPTPTILPPRRITSWRRWATYARSDG